MIFQMIRRQLCRQQPIQASPFIKKELKVIKQFTQNDLDKFSTLTGDLNPIHSTEVSIHSRKVHGAFLNAIIAGIIGTQFIGPGTILLEQKFKFPNPCRINIDIEIYLSLLKDRKISTVFYECRQKNLVVFIGDAKLLIVKNQSSK